MLEDDNMSISADSQSTIYQHPLELLQHLIRFDTTNSPGNEKECIMYIDPLLNKRRWPCDYNCRPDI